MFKFKLTVPAQEIGEELKIGDDVIFQGKGSIESRITKDNHDGTETITSIVTPSLVEMQRSDIKYEAPPVFKGEIKHKSMSQRVRDLLYRLHIERGGKEADFEAFYNERMTDYCEKIQDKIDQEKGL